MRMPIRVRAQADSVCECLVLTRSMRHKNLFCRNVPFVLKSVQRTFVSHDSRHSSTSGGPTGAGADSSRPGEGHVSSQQASPSLWRSSLGRSVATRGPRRGRGAAALPDGVAPSPRPSARRAAPHVDRAWLSNETVDGQTSLHFLFGSGLHVAPLSRARPRLRTQRLLPSAGRAS